MNKQERVQELINNMPEKDKKLLAFEMAKSLVQEKYKVSQWAHSGDGRWFQYCTDPGTSRPFTIYLSLNEHDDIRIKAVSMPVTGSMATLELGEFSYPNKNFDLQMRVFKDMIECLYDEFTEK